MLTSLTAYSLYAYGVWDYILAFIQILPTLHVRIDPFLRHYYMLNLHLDITL